jgi:Na+/proline symporter
MRKKAASDDFFSRKITIFAAPNMILITILCYFAVIYGVSRWTARRATNESFYRADRRAPWPMVAFGMVGASISGITFVSVPGMVLSSQMTYLQTCMGFILGYVVVAFVLLPLYYRLNLTSIYAYLGQRLGPTSHKTGSWFFLLSKMTGAAIKFYVVCMILQRFVFEPAGVPFAVTVVGLVLLIWLYTRRGGLKTLVWTDTVQTLCLFTALLLIIYKVVDDLGLGWSGAVEAVTQSQMSQVFVWDDWLSSQHFWKQFLSGVFIVVVMTGLDQDMMQKNLTCRTLRDAQKDMCCYGVAFLPANLLFLALGVLLALLVQQQGGALPTIGDNLLPDYVSAAADLSSPLTSYFIPIAFVLGIVAASFSSADSALASLTTIFCVDIMGRADDERLRKRTHLAMCAVFVVFVLLFRVAGSSSLIDTIYTLVGYTYGPLLGLFAYGLFTHRPVRNSWVPAVCIAAPVMCYMVQTASAVWLDYHFGYELLMLNGLLTFVGLWAISSSARLNTRLG